MIKIPPLDSGLDCIGTPLGRQRKAGRRRLELGERRQFVQMNLLISFFDVNPAPFAGPVGGFYGERNLVA
jgi:hypothetical protein